MQNECTYMLSYRIDSDYLCRQSVSATRGIKHILAFIYAVLGLALVQMMCLHVFYFVKFDHLNLQYVMYSLVLFVFCFTMMIKDYRIIHKGVPPYLSHRFWTYMYEKRYKRFLECNYSFYDSTYVLTYTGLKKARERKYKRIHKLYITDDIIYDGWALYIERAYMSEEEYNYVIQFLKSKVPENRIRFTI